MKINVSSVIGILLTFSLLIDPAWGMARPVAAPSTMIAAPWTRQAFIVPELWMHNAPLVPCACTALVRRLAAFLLHRPSVSLRPSLFGHHQHEDGTGILSTQNELIVSLRQAGFVVTHADTYPLEKPLWSVIFTVIPWARTHGLAAAGRVFIVSEEPAAQTVWPRPLEEMVTCTVEGAIFIHEKVLENAAGRLAGVRMPESLLDTNPTMRALAIALLHDSFEHARWRMENPSHPLNTAATVSREDLNRWHAEAQTLGFHFQSSASIIQLLDAYQNALRKGNVRQDAALSAPVTDVPASAPVIRGSTLDGHFSDTGYRIEVNTHIVLEAWTVHYAEYATTPPTTAKLTEHIRDFLPPGLTITLAEVQTYIDTQIAIGYLQKRGGRMKGYELTPAGDAQVLHDAYRTARRVAKLRQLPRGSVVLFGGLAHTVIGCVYSLEHPNENLLIMRGEQIDEMVVRGDDLDRLMTANELIQRWDEPDAALDPKDFHVLTNALAGGMFDEITLRRRLLQSVARRAKRNESLSLSHDEHGELVEAMKYVVFGRAARLMMKMIRLTTAGLPDELPVFWLYKKSEGVIHGAPLSALLLLLFLYRTHPLWTPHVERFARRVSTAA